MTASFDDSEPRRIAEPPRKQKAALATGVFGAFAGWHSVRWELSGKPEFYDSHILELLLDRLLEARVAWILTMPFLVRFRSAALERLETDAGFEAGFSRDIVKVYRKRIQFVRGGAR